MSAKQPTPQITEDRLLSPLKSSSPSPTAHILSDGSSSQQHVQNLSSAAPSIKQCATVVPKLSQKFIRSSIVAIDKDGKDILLGCVDVEVAEDALCSEDYMKDLAKLSISAAVLERFRKSASAPPSFPTVLSVFSLLDAILECDSSSLIKGGPINAAWYHAYFNGKILPMKKFWKCFFYALYHADTHRFDTNFVSKQNNEEFEIKLIFSRDPAKYLESFLVAQLSGLTGRTYQPEFCSFLGDNFSDQVSILPDNSIKITATNSQGAKLLVLFFLTILIVNNDVVHNDMEQNNTVSAFYICPVLWLLQKRQNQTAGTMNKLERNIIIAYTLMTHKKPIVTLDLELFKQRYSDLANIDEIHNYTCFSVREFLAKCKVIFWTQVTDEVAKNKLDMSTMEKVAHELEEMFKQLKADVEWGLKTSIALSAKELEAVGTVLKSLLPPQVSINQLMLHRFYSSPHGSLVYNDLMSGSNNDQICQKFVHEDANVSLFATLILNAVLMTRQSINTKKNQGEERNSNGNSPNNAASGGSIINEDSCAHTSKKQKQ